MMMMISKVKVAILDGRHDGRDRGASLKKDQPRLTWVPTIPLICTEYSTVLIILFFSGQDGFENFSSFSFLCFLTSQMKKVRWLQMRSTITWITFSFSRIKKIGLNFNLKQILIQNMLKIRSNIHLVASNIARITNAVQCKTLLLGHYYCNVLRFVSNVKNITSIFDSSYVSKALKITL